MKSLLLEEGVESTNSEKKVGVWKKKGVYSCLLILSTSSFSIHMVANTEVLRRIVDCVLKLKNEELACEVFHMFILMGINILFASVSKWLIVVLRKHETKELELKILKRYSNFKCWNVDTNMREYQAILINDVPQYINARVDLVSAFSEGILASIIAIIYALSIDVVSTCVSVGLTVFLYILLFRSLKKLSVYEKQIGEKHNESYSYTWNVFRNLEIVSFLLASKVYKRFDENTEEIVKCAKKKSKILANVSLGKNIINTGVLIVISLCIAVGSLILGKCYVSISDILALFIVIPQISSSMGKVLQLTSDYKTYKGIEERIEKAFLVPLYSRCDSKVDSIKEIRVENVSFNYATANTKLRRINCTVHKGENLLIFGPSGCGKSTLIKIMMGLVEEERGRVCVNGIDRKRIDRESLWKRCTYVSQESIIMQASILQNVILSQEYEEHRFWNVIEFVGLKSVIAKMPHQELTELTDPNVLSRGEKQKLCLARAMYKENVDVIILDEATAALDPSSERKLITRLLNYSRTQKKIMVWISHNEEMLCLADKVCRIG